MERRYPSPLAFYAAVLKGSPQRTLANLFVAWLQGPEGKPSFLIITMTAQWLTSRLLVSTCRASFMVGPDWPY
jgi:hypothetical protein